MVANRLRQACCFVVPVDSAEAIYPAEHTITSRISRLIVFRFRLNSKPWSGSRETHHPPGRSCRFNDAHRRDVRAGKISGRSHCRP
jgi:hypothetical protein